MKYSSFETKIIKNTGPWRQRLVVGTPTTGLVRMEWVSARYGQLIPTNWSLAEALQWMPSTAPLQYLVSDAQNIIVRTAIEQDAEWLFFLEQDDVMPPNTFRMLNDYMRKKTIPVISGLYFTKSEPPEPMIYRGGGNSYYDQWKMGDKVWASGVPTGCLLIHMSLLRTMWNDSPEYKVGDQITRKVFEEPERSWFDPKLGRMLNTSGTSDLAWCERVMKGHYFEKSGWAKYDKMRFPFLVDTKIFVKHITEDGRMYPLSIPSEFIKS